MVMKAARNKKSNNVTLERAAAENLHQQHQQQSLSSPAEMSTVTGLQIRKLDDVRAEVVGEQHTTKHACRHLACLSVKTGAMFVTVMCVSKSRMQQILNSWPCKTPAENLCAIRRGKK
jgi:hypothetical protein